jgi:hypothetical protein
MVKDMGNISPFLTPECTPTRPEIVDASTPWSDILLEELRTATQSGSRIPRRYGVAKFGSCRTHLRNQSRILWLTFLVIVGLFCAVKGGRQAVSDASKIVAQPKLDGLQFVGANHPSIRVPQPNHSKSSRD